MNGKKERNESGGRSTLTFSELRRTSPTSKLNLLFGFGTRMDTRATVAGSIVFSPESGGGNPCIPNIATPATLKAERLKDTESVPREPGGRVTSSELQC